MQRVWCAIVGCPQREKRGGVTPDGQALPDWLSWSSVVTTVDGEAVTTGEVVNLPLTYYGPSIPLGSGWAYGGSSRPPRTSTSASTSTTSPSTSHTTSSAATTASSSGTSSLGSSSSLTATASSSLSSSSVSSTSSRSSSTGTLSSSTSTSTPSPTFSSSSSSTAAPTSTTQHSHRNIPRIVLPSVLVPLFVLALLFLLLWCILKRRRDKSQQQRVAAFEPVPTSDVHEKAVRPGEAAAVAGGPPRPAPPDPGVSVPVGAATAMGMGGAAVATLGIAQPIMRISRDDVELHAPNYDDRRRSGSSVGSSLSGDESSALLGRSHPGSVHSSKYSLTGIGTAAAAGSAALMARLGRGRRASTASQFSDSSGASKYSNESPRNVSGNTMERMIGVQKPSPQATPSRPAGPTRGPSLEGVPWGAAAATAAVAGAAGLAVVADRSSSGGSKTTGARTGSGGTRSGSGTTRGGSGARSGSGGTHLPGDRSASGGTDAKRSSGRLSSDVGSADLWYNNRQTITASPDEEIAEAAEHEESPPIPESSRQGSSGQYVTADSGSISSYVSMGTDSTRSIYATQGSASSKSSRGSNRSGRSKASSGSRGSRAGASGRLATTIPEDAAVGAAGVLALGASAAAVYHARRSRNNTDETDIAVPRTSAAGSATPPAGIPRTLEAAGPSGDIGEFGTRIFVRQPTGESEADHPVPSSIGRPSFSERNTSVGTFGTPVEEDSRGSSDYPNFPVFARGRTSISSLPATSSVPEDNSPMGSMNSLQTHAGYLAPAISAGAAAAGVGAVAAGAAVTRHGTSQPGDSPTRSTSALAVPTGGIRRESTPSHLLPGAVPIDPGSGALLSPFGQVGVGQLATPQTAGSGGSSSDHGRRHAPRQHPLAVPAKRGSGQSEDKRTSGLTDKSDPAAPIAPSRVAPLLGPGTHIQQRQMSRSVGDLVNTTASAPASAHDSSFSSGEGTGRRPRVAVLDEFGVVHESASRSAPLLSRTLWSTGNSGNSGQSTGTSALGSLGSVSEYGEPLPPISPISPAAVIGPTTPDRAVRGRISKPEMVELPPSRQTSAGNSSGSDPPPLVERPPPLVERPPPLVERPLPPLPTLPTEPSGSPSTPRATPAFVRVAGRRGLAEGEELLSPPRPDDDDDDDDTPRRQAGWSPKWFKWSPNKRG